MASPLAASQSASLTLSDAAAPRVEALERVVAEIRATVAALKAAQVVARAKRPATTKSPHAKRAKTETNGANARTIVDDIILAAYQQRQNEDPFVLDIPPGVVPASNNGASLRYCFWDAKHPESYPRFLEKVKHVDGAWVRQPTSSRLGAGVHVRFTLAGLARARALRGA